MAAAQKEGLVKNELDRQFARMKEIPFDSGRKLMTTVHIIPSGYRIITKGAPDVLLKKCVNQSDVFLRENEKMAQQALRVIAVAYRDVSVLGAKLEENLTFAGLVGMIDPPRPEVSEAVQTWPQGGH